MGSLRVTRALLNGTPFLIQVISGGGIPVAEQVKVTGSISFTLYVKVLSGGKVMFGFTAWKRTVEKNIGLESQFPLIKHCRLTMHSEFSSCSVLVNSISSLADISTSIRGVSHYDSQIAHYLSFSKVITTDLNCVCLCHQLVTHPPPCDLWPGSCSGIAEEGG